MKSFLIIGKNKAATLELHNRFSNDKKGVKQLMLSRIMVIGKTVDGAMLTIRNRSVNKFISTKDIINRITEQLDTLVYGEDYVIEVKE